MKIFTIPLVFLITVDIFSQFEIPDIGSRSVSLGGAFTSLADNSEAVFYNPAGLSQIKYREISFFYSPAPFGLTEMKHAAFSYVEPTNYGCFGVSAINYGFELYREITATLSYANNYNQKILFGTNLHFYQLRIERYGSASSFGIDIGLLAKITRYLQWGFSATNLNRPKIGITNDRLPNVYKSGLTLFLRRDLIINIDAEKDTRFPVSFRGGMEYILLNYLSLRTGVGTEPVKFTGGVGISYSLIGLDYAIHKHQDLGFTHQFSLSVNFGGNNGRIKARESLYGLFDYPPPDSHISRIIKSKKLKIGQTVNLNSAGADSLKMLPYISEKTAALIIEYRQANGGFKTIDELLNIKGIGEKKLEKMKPYIRLE